LIELAREELSGSGAGRESMLSRLAELMFIEALRRYIWRALEVEGPIPFEVFGLLERLIHPLAESAIPIFAVTTYDTDLVLVRAQDLVRALEVLRAVGHSVAAAP